MKKVISATIALCAAITAGAAQIPAAAATAAAPDYPVVFSQQVAFGSLTDYAVGGDAYAFIDGGNLRKLDGEILVEYSFAAAEAESGEIKAEKLDYADGEFYFTVEGESGVYLLPGEGDSRLIKAENPPQGLFEKSETFDVGGYYYYFNADTQAFTALNRGTDATHTFEGLGCIKAYNNVIYGIYQNELYSIEGFNQTKIEFTFSNFGLLESIATGGVPQKLQSYQTYGDAPKLVNVTAGSNITEIDLNELVTVDGTGKPVSAAKLFPVKSGRKDTVQDEGGGALLLCTEGTVAVVSRGTKCYILNSGNVSDVGQVVSTPQSANARAVITAADWAHALPYMSNATRVFKVTPGQELTVIAKLAKEDNPELAHDFYLVQNADGQSGYVAAEFLTVEYPAFNEGGTTELPDPDPKFDDNVKVVTLVLVIVVIVLIAAGYVIWVSAYKKADEEADPHDDTAK